MNTSADSPNTLQLVYSMDLDINIFDTDCFGVMWHGAYTKWMEMGRVKLLEDRGLTMSKPGEPGGLLYPVVEQNLKYKRSAPYGDKLTMTTRLTVESYKLIFHQHFRSHQSDCNTLEATTTVVVVDNDWKLQRRLPQALKDAIGLA